MSCSSNILSSRNNCICWVYHFVLLIDDSPNVKQTIKDWLTTDNYYVSFNSKVKDAHIYFKAALNLLHPKHIETFNKYSLLI